jgi:hypothetical protein
MNYMLIYYWEAVSMFEAYRQLDGRIERRCGGE